MNTVIRRAAWAAAALLVITALAAAKSAPSAARAPEVSRALAGKLQAGRRAEVAFKERLSDPMAGTLERGGRLMIEAPALVRMEYAEGDVLTLRPDGGEWLQPALGQMLRFGAAGQEVARVWRMLLGTAGEGVSERRRSTRSWVLVPSSSGVADSAWVDLDAAGLPARLTVFTGDDSNVEYRFTGWRFVAPRGKAAFTVQAPKGIQVIEASAP
jgi:hypothetical protein